ncbi:MAG: hypothetical protein MI866_22380, partial [Bacteroidales bacterium]|nr:hypothetical protein [Bacteroidales bacterium]
MMNCLRVIIFYIFSLTGFCISAQTTLRFDNFSTQDGLGNNVIFDAKTDTKGQLWLATFDGLSCYNGYRFKTFKPDVSNPRVTGSNIIRVIEPDDYGNIWFATAGSSFSILNPETNEFQYYNTPDLSSRNIKRSDIHSICHFQQTVWLASSEAIYIFDRETQRISAFTTKEFGLNGEISGLLNIDDHITLVCTQQGVLMVRHKNPDNKYTVIDRHSLNFNGTIHGISGSDTHIFLVSRGLIKSYRKENDQLIPAFEIQAGQLSTTNIQAVNFESVTAISDNEYWIASSAGLIVYNTDKPEAFQLVQADENDPESLSGNLITSICKDREGNVWLTNRFNGLSKYNPTSQAFLKYSKETRLGRSMINNDVRAILAEQNGNLWIGYRDAGIDLIDGASGGITHFNSNQPDIHRLPSNSIRAIHQDRNGSIWIGTARGASKLILSNGRYQIENISEINGQSLGIVYIFLEDSSGRFWIGSNRGLFLYSEKDNSSLAFHQTVTDNNSRFL